MTRRSDFDALADDVETGTSAFELPWGLGFGALAALLLAGIILQGAGWLGPSLLAQATLSMHMSVAGAGLMAIAAALYLVTEDSQIEWLGLGASRTALIGALGLVGGSMLRAAEAGLPLTGVFEYQVGLEAPGLIAAIAVLVYLRIEQAWQTRRAGALVLGLALIALALDVWLMSGTRGVPEVLGRVMDEHLIGLWHLGGKLGVLASVILTMWAVFRRHLRIAAAVLLEQMLRAAMAIGLSGFTVALLSAMALNLLPGPSPDSLSRFMAGAVVWLCFGVLYLAWRRAGASTARLGAWILGTLFPAGAAYLALGWQG